jgi:MSHA biogenesis protein MshK
MKIGRQKAEGRGRTGIARSAGSSFAQLVVLIGAMSTSGASAWAQINVDPMRPAAGISAEMPDDTAPGNQLQSVMISPTRHAAIINGVVVELGAKYGDAVLMRVAEDEVVLRSGSSQQVLKLFPAVERADAAAPGRVRGRGP